MVCDPHFPETPRRADSESESLGKGKGTSNKEGALRHHKYGGWSRCWLLGFVENPPLPTCGFCSLKGPQMLTPLKHSVLLHGEAEHLPVSISTR